MKKQITRLVCALFVAGTLTVSAQNTSLGHESGTFKDTSVTYRENPAKHVHQEVIPIDKKEKAPSKQNQTSNSGKNYSNSQGQSAATDNSAQDTAVAAPETSSTTVTEVTQAPAPAEVNPDETCSCTKMNVAFGLAGLSLLAFFIVLAMYMNEKKRKRSRD